MATGAPGTNGVWQYGEDDSEATFSALLNKVASTTDTQIGTDRSRITALEASGRVVETKQTVKTNVFTTSASTPTDVTGLSVSITPKSSSNKVLVTVGFTYANLNGSNGAKFWLVRNSTAIGTAATGYTYFPFTNNVNSNDAIFFSFLDSPATTSATTYKLQTAIDAAGTVIVGTYGAGGGAGNPSISTITVQEIDG